MLWSNSLKGFSEQLNELNVDYSGINPMDNFEGKTIDILLKTITHGAVHFMYWIQDFKAT